MVGLTSNTWHARGLNRRRIALSPRPASSCSHATTRYELDAGLSPASTCSTSPARTASSIDASRTKPEYNRSSSRSDIESRSTPLTCSSTRGRCNQRKRTSASRVEVTARSRKPRSISASEEGSLFRRVARDRGDMGRAISSARYDRHAVARVVASDATARLEGPVAVSRHRGEIGEDHGTPGSMGRCLHMRVSSVGAHRDRRRGSGDGDGLSWVRV